MWYKKKKLSIYKQHLMDFKSSDSYHSQMQYTLRNTEYRDLIFWGLEKITLHNDVHIYTLCLFCSISTLGLCHFYI